MVVQTGKSNKEPAILVVDDDVGSLEAVEEVLQRAGYLVLATTDVLEALDYCSQMPCYLTILDVHMPDITGFEVYEKLLDLYPYPIPCIFVTADHSKEIKLKAMEVGAFTILYKPISPKILRYTVEKALTQRR